MADTRLLMRGGAIAAPAVGASMPVKDSSEVNNDADEMLCVVAFVVVGCCWWGVSCVSPTEPLSEP